MGISLDFYPIKHTFLFFFLLGLGLGVVGVVEVLGAGAGVVVVGAVVVKPLSKRSASGSSV